jgi:hypothetical protein
MIRKTSNSWALSMAAMMRQSAARRNGERRSHGIVRIPVLPAALRAGIVADSAASKRSAAQPELPSSTTRARRRL